MIPQKENVIRAAIRIDPPYANECILKDFSSCAKFGGPGINYEIFEAVMRNLGLKFKILPNADGDTGRPDANGSWNGLMGQLQRKEIDMSAYCRNSQIFTNFQKFKNSEINSYRISNTVSDYFQFFFELWELIRFRGPTEGFQ